MKLGLIGHDIAKSRSPQLYRFLSAHLNVHLEYELIDNGRISTPENFKVAVIDFFRNGGQGLSVTAPYKQFAYDITNYHSYHAGISRSVNLITMDEKGGLVGTNTDVSGFSASMENFGFETPKTILILGNGGVVPSLLMDLSRYNCLVHICARDKEKTRNITKHYTDSFTALTIDQVTGNYDLVIDTTDGCYGDNFKFTFNHGYSLSVKDNAFRNYCLRMNIPFRNGLDMLIHQGLSTFHCVSGTRIDINDIPWIFQAMRRGAENV